MRDRRMPTFLCQREVTLGLVQGRRDRLKYEPKVEIG